MFTFVELDLTQVFFELHLTFTQLFLTLNLHWSPLSSSFTRVSFKFHFSWLSFAVHLTDWFSPVSLRLLFGLFRCSFSQHSLELNSTFARLNSTFSKNTEKVFWEIGSWNWRKLHWSCESGHIEHIVPLQSAFYARVVGQGCACRARV